MRGKDEETVGEFVHGREGYSADIPERIRCIKGRAGMSEARGAW
jgi:hypothetical protein